MVPLPPGPAALAPSGSPPPPPPRLLLLPTPGPAPPEPPGGAPPPRKRQRLSHLSPEEKALRRKLKNRVAAQSARDRKKARMGELERQAVELEAENQKLLAENQRLREQTHSLALENQELRLRLGLPALEGGGSRDADPTTAAVTASPAVLKVEMVEPEEGEGKEEEEGKGATLCPQLVEADPARPAPGSAKSAALSLRVPPQQGQAQTSPASTGTASAAPSFPLLWIRILLTLQMLSPIFCWAFWTAWTRTSSSASLVPMRPAWRSCNRERRRRRKSSSSSESVPLGGCFWGEKGAPYEPPRVPLWGPHHPSWRPLMN